MLWDTGERWCEFVFLWSISIANVQSVIFWWVVKSKAIPLQLIDIINVKIAAVVCLVRVDCYPDELIRGDKTGKKKEAAQMALSFLCQEVVPLFLSPLSSAWAGTISYFCRLWEANSQTREQQRQHLSETDAQLSWIVDVPCWFWLPLLPAAIHSQVN